jgi:hypothetical protein
MVVPSLPLNAGFGHADSTMSGYNSSIVYLNKFLSEYSFPPFEDLMLLHVKGEHMENMIETAARCWLVC